MPRDQTDESFRDALPRLLTEQGMSLRELSRRMGVDATYLSRVRRGRKRLPSRLPGRVAISLGLPEDYFPETREALIMDAIRSSSDLREEIYERFVRGRRATSERKR
jgi:transcriptional regulator with XRE-family HTH domain